MDGGCILMILSVLFGLGGIVAGFNALSNPARAPASPQACFVVGIIFLSGSLRVDLVGEQAGRRTLAEMTALVSQVYILPLFD
jgi:hypothetical protein